MTPTLARLRELAENRLLQSPQWTSVEDLHAWWAALQQREAALPDEALTAITIEHERDHTDGPNEPREGCVGCRMLAEIRRLHRVVAQREAALEKARELLRHLDTWSEGQKQACCVVAITELRDALRACREGRA